MNGKKHETTRAWEAFKALMDYLFTHATRGRLVDIGGTQLWVGQQVGR